MPEPELVFPPPTILKWVNGRTVNLDELVKEMKLWAEHMESK